MADAGASAAIYGLAGPELTTSERAFFRDAAPWGFILFARNVATPDQLRRLTGALREATGRAAPILVDQEGGRVARLRPPHWRAWPPVARYFQGSEPGEGAERLGLHYRLIAADLAAVGIDVNCAPLLDIPAPDAHPVISERALGTEAGAVAARGRVACDALTAGGLLPVVKHLPGHGRARADSHERLPVVETALEDLAAVDFAPFCALSDQPLGMTAHVLYSALDADAPATLSPGVIGVIRGQIGFDGLLMTDDLSMAALDGPMRLRGERALAAGCDILLHCNGDMAEMTAVAAAAPRLAGRSAERAARAEAARRSPEPADLEALEARYRALEGEAA